MYVKYIKYISSLPFTSSKRSSKQSVNMLFILSHLLLISPMYLSLTHTLSLCPPSPQLTTYNSQLTIQIANYKSHPTTLHHNLLASCSITSFQSIFHFNQLFIR